MIWNVSCNRVSSVRLERQICVQTRSSVPMPEIVLKRNCRFARSIWTARRVRASPGSVAKSQKAPGVCPRYRTNEQTKQDERMSKGRRLRRSRLPLLWFSMVRRSQIGPGQLRNKCSADLNHAFASTKPSRNSPVLLPFFYIDNRRDRWCRST